MLARQHPNATAEDENGHVSYIIVIIVIIKDFLDFCLLDYGTSFVNGTIWRELDTNIFESYGWSTRQASYYRNLCKI
jgi:hypothetical protein